MSPIECRCLAGWSSEPDGVVECLAGVARGREVGRPVRREVLLPVPVRSAEGDREPIGLAQLLRGSRISGGSQIRADELDLKSGFLFGE